MHDAPAVEGAQRGGGRGQASDDVAEGQSAAGQPLGQILAGEPLHGQVVQPVRSLAVRNIGNDIGMRELGKELGFPREPLRTARCGGRAVDNLQRHRLARPLIDGAIDRSHATAAGYFFDRKAICNHGTSG